MSHTLKYLHRPCKLHTLRYNMREHSEFLITSGALMDFYCDLGGCIIQTREPYLVAKIHGFRTQVNDAQTYATQETDWQPREDWQEMYDPNEHFCRPERHGIGFDD